jgi:hypothetical protein
VTYIFPLEQHVVDTGPGEVMAHGETTGAGSDDDDRRMHFRLSVAGAWLRPP